MYVYGNLCGYYVYYRIGRLKVKCLISYVGVLLVNMLGQSLEIKVLELFMFYDVWVFVFIIIGSGFFSILVIVIIDEDGE